MARATDAKLYARLLDRLWPHHALQKSGEEHLVPCPFCASEKAKCWVNPDKGVFQCWVCGEKGPTGKFIYHLRDLGHIKQTDVNAIMGGGARGLSNAIDALVPDTRKKAHVDTHLWTPEEPCVYPKYAQPLTAVREDGFTGKMRQSAINYLKRRGFSLSDVDRFRIQYLVNLGDRYHGHLIFPILDRFGRQLRYWTTRTIFKGGKPKSLHANGKYTRFSAKHVLMYEDMIMKGLPLAVCEGPFDAMSVNKHVMPCVALLGKNLHPYHLEALRATQPSEVVMCLDPDAIDYAQEAARRIRNLMIPVRVLELDGGDPNDISPDSLKGQFQRVMTTPTEGLHESDPDLPPEAYWSPKL